MPSQSEMIPVFSRRQTVGNTHTNGTFDVLYDDALPAGTMSDDPGDDGPFLSIHALEATYEGRFNGRSGATDSIMVVIGDVEIPVIDSLTDITAKAFWQAKVTMVRIDDSTAGLTVDSQVAWKDAGDDHAAGDVFVHRHAFLDVAVDFTADAAIQLQGATSGGGAAAGDVDVRMGRAVVHAVVVS